MQIYQVPDWRLVFLVKNFPVGLKVLVDSSFGQPIPQGEVRKEEVTRQSEIPLVKEVLLVGLGNRQSRPYLLVRCHLRQSIPWLSESPRFFYLPVFLYNLISICSGMVHLPIFLYNLTSVFTGMVHYPIFMYN